jgi:hypothetical protein
MLTGATRTISANHHRMLPGQPMAPQACNGLHPCLLFFNLWQKEGGLCRFVAVPPPQLGTAVGDQAVGAP